MITLYHNPKCSTSRKVLTRVQETGQPVRVVDYQQTPPDRATLRRLIADAGLTVRQALRRRNTPYDELGLDDPALDDEALLDAILAHPLLLERPFVTTEKGTRLARPVERVEEIL